MLGMQEIKILVSLLFVGGVFCSGAWVGFSLRGKEVRLLKDKNAALRAAYAERERAAARASAEAETQYSRRMNEAAEVVAKLKREIEHERRAKEVLLKGLRHAKEILVPSGAPADYPVSVGFVRLHNMAVEASGGEDCPDAASGPAGKPDEAPAEVGLSATAEVILQNYAAYDECRRQVEAWQRFYDGLRKSQAPEK